MVINFSYELMILIEIIFYLPFNGIIANRWNKLWWTDLCWWNYLDWISWKVHNGDKEDFYNEEINLLGRDLKNDEDIDNNAKNNKDEKYDDNTDNIKVLKATSFLLIVHSPSTTFWNANINEP